MQDATCGVGGTELGQSFENRAILHMDPTPSGERGGYSIDSRSIAVPFSAPPITCETQAVPNDFSFVAVDFETANSHPGSICAVGVVGVRDAKVTDRWSTLVNPEDEFNEINVGIHGITPDQVARAPTFEVVHGALLEWLDGGIMVAHGAFDRAALNSAIAVYSMAAIEVDFVNSQTVVRRTWPNWSRKGYGLAAMSEALGIPLNHHDPLSDAEAAAEIMISAWKESDFRFDERIQGWSTGELGRGSPTDNCTGEGNPDGIFAGEVVVFTGAAGPSRKELSEAANELGMTIKASVTKDTTMLVSGEVTSPLVKGGRSSKQKKAEQLIAQGHDIHIMGPDEFLKMIEFDRRRGEN